MNCAVKGGLPDDARFILDFRLIYLRKKNIGTYINKNKHFIHTSKYVIILLPYVISMCLMKQVVIDEIVSSAL